MLTLAVARGAGADTVDASATLLVAGRQEPRDGQAHSTVPTFGLVSLRADQLTNPLFSDLRIIVSTWGGVDPGDPRNGRHYDYDLNLAFVEGRLLHGRVLLRVGRQMRIGGSARNLQFDGGMAEVRPLSFLGIAVFGGAPVAPRFGVRVGDAVGGARLFVRPSVNSELGVGFLHLLAESVVARQEASIDARWVPIQALALSGYAFWSTVEARLAEGEVAARWQPVRPLELMVNWRHTAPDLFLSRTSIFSVFSVEERDEVGGMVFLQPAARLRLDADYHVLRLPGDSGLGQDGGARVRYALGRRWQTSIGAEGRVLTSPSNGYAEGRVFGLHRFSSVLSASLDLAAYVFAHPINGQDLSATATATVAYAFGEHWRMVVVGIADVTPFVERGFEAMAKLTYDLALGSRRVVQR